jgi:hypothetical protein
MMTIYRAGLHTSTPNARGWPLFLLISFLIPGVQCNYEGV